MPRAPVPRRRALATRLGRLAAVAVLVAAVARAAAPVAAASLVQVTGFGSNPGGLVMYEYVPDGLPAGAPLVVALHGCTQTAADYHNAAGWPKYAELWRFALVFPQQQTANNANRCFNWFQPGDYRRGQGEALSIRQMVESMRARHGIDARRVHVTGLSAGGAMTAVMLAAYPDVFAGGGVMAGVPYACATDVVSGFNCMSTSQGRTPRQWGDLVRDANPGWTGPWPRVAIWHGTSDATVNPVNATEARDQWTDVWGIGQTPSTTVTLPGNGNGATTETGYNDATGRPAVKLYQVQGMGHGTAVDPGAATQQCGTTGAFFLSFICSTYHTARFWGLDGGTATTTTTPPGPTTTSPPTTTTPPPACFTASNYGHVQAGRATQRLGVVYANGSDQRMGLYNTFETHTLARASPGYYVLADDRCPP
jgi:poly(hydroxyalkanoate) depolymerase family esterase